MITIDAHSYFYNNEKKPLMNSSSGAVTTVEHDTSNTNATISPNTLHKWDEVAELTLALGDETPGIANEYLIQFTSGATPTVLTLPKDVKWATPLKISKNKTYLISIVNNLATFAEFDALNGPLITLNLTIDDVLEIGGIGLLIINPDMISQLQTLCSWIIANEHTGEDIDNKIAELTGSLPPEMLNIIPGVVYEGGFLIIKFPSEIGIESELVYGNGFRMSAVDPGMSESMYALIPNDLNYTILAMLDLDTGGLTLNLGM